jgi:rhodanese-related sulfurtransferase
VVLQVEQVQQPIILCCASGNRSGQATQYSKQLGINCENSGSWIAVNNN